MYVRSCVFSLSIPENDTEHTVVFVTDSGRQQPARLWKYPRHHDPKITTLRLVMPDNLVVGYLNGDLETFRQELRATRETSERPQNQPTGIFYH